KERRVGSIQCPVCNHKPYVRREDGSLSVPFLNHIERHIDEGKVFHPSFWDTPGLSHSIINKYNARLKYCPAPAIEEEPEELPSLDAIMERRVRMIKHLPKAIRPLFAPLLSEALVNAACDGTESSI